MKLKKIINFILIFILSVCCVLPIVACKKTVDTAKIFDPIANSKMEQFDSQSLTVIDGINLSNVTWEITSGSENAELDGNTVFAVKQAKYGEKTQKQTVSVIKGANPTIEVEDLPLLIGSSFKIEPKTKFKSKEIRGVTYELTSSNTGVVTTSAQTLSAISEGTATITVTANYKGNIVSTASFICTVNGNRGIIPNKTAYDLYLCDNFLGVDFYRELPLYGSVYNDGALVKNAEIEWRILDEDIATIVDGKIVSVALGQTSLKGVCTVAGQTIETVNIPVNVKTAMVESAKEIVLDLSKQTHTFDSLSIFGTQDAVGYLTNEKTLYSYNVVENSIQTAQFVVGEYNYFVYSENEVYAVKTQLIVADYVVSDLETLKGMYDYTNGYIAMTNDVEINGAYSTGAEKATTFEGTFNGLGHKIIGMTLSKGSAGLFYMTNGAKIKNVGFIDANITKESGNGVLCYQARATLAVDNVYIDVDINVASGYDFNGGAIGLLFQCTLNISNSIIICNGLYKDGAVDGDNGGFLGRCTGNVVMDNTFIITDGYACATKIQENNTEYQKINSIQGIYSSEEEFLADKNSEHIGLDFSGFNTEYWKLDGMPCYK